MFADLSGFTVLTEHLMSRGAQGAEQLSEALNHIFAPLVRLVYDRGGFIPYFAGDAFMAVFPSAHSAMTALEALHVAVTARAFFAGKGFHVGEFPISIKIGAAFGEVEWGIVGQKRKSFYFRGRAVHHCAQGQIAAGNLEIVLDSSMKELLDSRGLSFQPAAENYWKLTTIPPISPVHLQPTPLSGLEEEIVLQFLPAEVFQTRTGGEFRTVISIFIGFSGVSDHDSLEQFSRVVLDQAENFSGYFKEIDFGDKGGVMVVFFGAPVSYENNLSRALEFFFALQAETKVLQQTDNLRFKAGISIGTAFTGIVGGAERCQYAAVGKSVNLAVRLMSHADWGEALVDSEISKNRQYRFRHKGDIKYKGIKGNVPTYMLEGRHIGQIQDLSNPLVGRSREMRQLLDFAEPLFDLRSAGMAVLIGEPGIGKSRLSGELRRALQESRQLAWYTCVADQILRKPWNAFLFFLRNYFEQSSERLPQENQRHFEINFDLLLQSLAQKNPPGEVVLRRELNRLKPILAGLLGIHYPESLWEQLDAKGRYDNTRQAIIHLITVEAAIQPVVLEIEDAQWLDEDALGLLRDISLRLAVLPVMLLITTRPGEDGKIPEIVPMDTLRQFHLPVLTMSITPLDSEAVTHFAELHLKGKIAPEFQGQLVKHTNNNPFYLEQVLEYCLERKLLHQEDGVWHLIHPEMDISGSIQSILTARIDRLSALARETVKAASVIGREFEVPVLNQVMSQQEGFSSIHGNTEMMVQEQIKTAEQGQIWHALSEMRYIFRHSLLREAAYHMQMRSRLNHLHALIAQAIEQLHAQNLPERYADLAFHYEQAGITDKTCEYLLKAADFARRNYQNQQAIFYYDKLIHLIPPDANPALLVKAHLRRGKILEQTGRWNDCRQSYARALRFARKSGESLLLGQAFNHLGQVLLLLGDYPGALKYFHRASEIFERAHDSQGIARTYGNLGNLYFRQGNYPEAKASFSKSLALARETDPADISAQTVAQFALAYMNQGEYDNAVTIIEEQIPRSRQLGDKPGLASLFTNLGIIFFEKGDYAAALDSHREGLTISETLGNTMLTAINIGCIGSVYERRGEYEQAMQHFVKDLELVEAIGDKQGVAIALHLIGELLCQMGDFGKAVDYLQKSLMLCEELGYQKGIGRTVNTLGDIAFFTGQFSRAIAFYDRAIQITRQIDAKLVLGYSLLEKGLVLAELKQSDELYEVVREAMQLAQRLDNANLEFDARLLHAQWLFLQGQDEDAKEELQRLDSLAKESVQTAALTFQRWKFDPQNTRLKHLALELYKALYRQTPKYLYKARMVILES